MIIHIVTVYTPTSIENTFVYTKKEQAELKFTHLAKEYCTEEIEFNSIDAVYEYMSSEEWFDLGLDTRIEIDEVVLEGLE